MSDVQAACGVVGFIIVLLCIMMVYKDCSDGSDQRLEHMSERYKMCLVSGMQWNDGDCLR